MRDEDIITRNLKEKQATFFRVAARRGFTLPVLAAETEIAQGTLASYCRTPSREPAAMPLGTFIKLGRIKEIGDLVALLIEDSGQTLAPIETRDADWLALGEKACAFGSKVLRYQSTGGHIDHIEAADLRDEAIIIASAAHGAISRSAGGAG